MTPTKSISNQGQRPSGLPLLQRVCDHPATSYEEDRRTRGMESAGKEELYLNAPLLHHISNEWVDLLKCPPPQLFSRDSLRR